MNILVVQVVIIKPLRYNDAYNSRTNKRNYCSRIAPTQTGVKVMAGSEEQGEVGTYKQNAQINYQNLSVIGNSISAGTAFNYEENTIQLVQKIPPNKPNIEWTGT